MLFCLTTKKLQELDSTQVIGLEAEKEKARKNVILQQELQENKEEEKKLKLTDLSKSVLSRPEVSADWKSTSKWDAEEVCVMEYRYDRRSITIVCPGTLSFGSLAKFS